MGGGNPVPRRTQRNLYSEIPEQSARGGRNELIQINWETRRSLYIKSKHTKAGIHRGREPAAHVGALPGWPAGTRCQRGVCPEPSEWTLSRPGCTRLQQPARQGCLFSNIFCDTQRFFFIFFIWGRAGGWSGASELTAHGQGGRRSPGGRPSPAQTGGHGHAGSPTRAAPRACSGVCALGGLRGVQERHVTRVHIQHRPSFPLYTFSAQAHEISREARSQGQEGKGAPGTRVAQFVTL